MLKGFKTEILPTPEQAIKIRKMLGTCRYLYNLYLASNFEVYEALGKGFFVTAYTFDKYVNHVVKRDLPWIDECGAKARKQALMNAERAFKNYMKGKANRPRYKKKREQKVKAYFPKNAKGDWTIWRHKIQVPTIGKVKLKEKGIEVRIVDRFYPSSKKCSKCGRIKTDLKLKDRVYRCECGLELDRDLNAAINLKNATEYKIV